MQSDNSSWARGSFWAPEVNAYRGKYYLVYSALRTPEQGYRICLAAGESPSGPFRDTAAPLFDLGWKCIDPHVFVDTDSIPYLFFNRVAIPDTVPGRMLSKIHVTRLSSDLLSLADSPRVCLDTYQPWEDSVRTGNWCNEGAHVFKRGSIYYLTYSAGHYAHPGYSIGYATASRPLGPWTKADNNPLAAMDSTVGVAGPGHNGIAWSPDNTECFLVYHAHESLGRIGTRTLCIDRLVFGTDGRLSLVGPTRTPQPLPSGARALRLDDLPDSLAARVGAEKQRAALWAMRRQMRSCLYSLPPVLLGSGLTDTLRLTLVNTSPTTVTSTISWTDEIPLFPPAESAVLRPGKSHEAVFTCAAPDTFVDLPTVCWRISRHDSTLIEHRGKLQSARIALYACSTGHSHAGPALAVAEPNQVVSGREEWHGPHDCAARAWLLRTPDALDILVEVADDILNTRATEILACDGVELYFDTRSRSERGGRRPRGGVLELVVVPGFGKAAARLATYPPHPAVADSVQVASEMTPMGYRVSVVVPLSALVTGNAPGPRFNFDLGVNDADERPVRATQLMWSGDENNARDPSRFGRLAPRP